MKRIVLLIGALLLGLAARAQSVTYTCRYWFDEDFAQATTTTFSASTWQAELDVGSLTEGLHALHLHVMDTSMKWSAPQSYLFLKLTPPASLSDFTYYYWFDQDHASMQSGALGDGHLLLDVDDLSEGLHAIHVMLKGGEYSASQTYLFLKADAWQSGTPNYVYHCWFDDDFANQQTDALGSGHLLLDVVGLEDGMHTVHVLVEGSTLTSTQSYLFMKVAPFAADSIDMTHLSYHCWFDEDFEHQQIDSLGDGHLLLDVNNLEDGLHTVHVMLQGSTLTATQSYMFMKMAVEDPSTEMQYICWFDQDYSNAQTGPLGSGLFELEVSDLPNGIHAVNVQLSNGTRTAPQCYLFYKQPLGGYGIARWEYWLNDDIANRQITNISPTVDTLEIISLLNVGHPALRSSCFHFHPNGDAPYINAKNQINFRFYDCELRFIDKSAYYVDEQVQQNIVATVFERNTTETFAAPRDNQIQWFKVEAGVGDSLAFVADKACTMQLFAPSGEEVYAATASEAMVFGGCHAWEDGAYYLAVHDQTGSGEMLSVSYQYINKYAVLAYDVHSVGNGGRSTITFQGNGFNSLLDAYIVNYQNDTIHRLDIGHESNTTTTVTFNFYQENLGVYDAVFQFVDDVIQIQNAIQVEEATPFAFDATVTFATQFLRTTSNNYVFQVHNYSNMTAYNVPLAVYIYTPDSESLTRVDIEGFDVKSDIIQLLGSYYTDSLNNVIEQKRLTSGDMFGFLEEPNTDYVPDAPYLHHIFITPTLRPNITETFTIAVKSENTVSVYMWYPEEWENEDTTGNLSKTRSAYDGICAIANNRKRMCDKNAWLVANGGDPIYNVNCDDLPKPSGNCPPPPGGHSTPVNSLDPNDIHGYLSESGSHFMRQEIQNVQYEIEFENDTTLATAAAHTIIVRDTLDATKFDLNSLAARSVTIGDKRLELNGEQTFARTLDMRPELYVIAQIEQDYDPTTGIVEWTIQSLDPMTMEPTDNPYQGVLPVNYFGDGVGFIDYSINLKQAFADGTTISNRAGIIFDQNDVIMTPTWTNTVDAVKPTSHIEEVTPVADSLSFNFVSEDNRSGVWYHSLYYRNASTEQEWQVRKAQIFEDSFVLHLEDLLTTEYLVIAVDSAGNREDKDMVAEYIYTAAGLHFVSEGNWSTASNWQEGTLPEADDVAFINAPCQLDQDAEVAALAISDDQTLTVQSSKTLTVNGLLFNPSAEGLVIEDGAQLINATSNVAATMEKGIAAYPNSGPDGWYTIASPMDEMPIAESDFLTPNFDLYRFDETNLTHEEWQNYKANHPDFATFEKGRGYLYANSNSFAPAFMGTLSNTAATYHLTYTERPDALSGFNLIGNPFPHVIYKGAGGAIDNAQLASGYYTLTNEGAWHVHTYEDAIMPGQGILVKTMADLDLTIAKSNATALSESSNAKASSSRVVLKVSGSWGEDRAFVYFGQGIGLDKMENLSRTVPSLWIRDNGHDYAIAHVDSDCESLELFFSNMQSDDFTLSVDVSDTSFSVLQLTDRITGVTIDLLQQPSYVFHSAGQENEARFSLTFKMETMR